jgi:copper(I)-binding protein
MTVVSPRFTFFFFVLLAWATGAPHTAAAEPAPSEPLAPPTSTNMPSSTPSSRPLSTAGDCRSLVFEEPWVRIVPPGTPNTAAYFRVHHSLAKDVAIVAVTTPWAKRTELHGMSMAQGMTRMVAVQEVIVPEGKTVALAPGGLHAMLFGYAPPSLPPGEVPLTVWCKDGSQTSLAATTRSSAPRRQPDPPNIVPAP